MFSSSFSTFPVADLVPPAMPSTTACDQRVWAVVVLLAALCLALQVSAAPANETTVAPTTDATISIGNSSSTAATTRSSSYTGNGTFPTFTVNDNITEACPFADKQACIDLAGQCENPPSYYFALFQNNGRDDPELIKCFTAICWWV